MRRVQILKTRFLRRNIAAVTNGKANAAANSDPAIPFKFWFWGNVFDLLRAHGKALLICVTIGFGFFELSEAVRAFAGHVTLARVTLKFLANIVLHWIWTISVSGISIALYVREKRQHERTRERLTKRITMLESKIDTGRSSSQLTSKGRTRKEDE